MVTLQVGTVESNDRDHRLPVQWTVGLVPCAGEGELERVSWTHLLG